jgi:tRNA-dihydrouridine synthase
MDDVTDTVFRQIVAECAPPHLFFTEFVNVDGLQSPGRQRLLKKLRFTAAEQPLFAQIWGKEPNNFYKTAQELADGTFVREMGLPENVQFAGIDLNMGCPDKTVVKNGTCSALINNRGLALEIIQATQAGAGDRLPVSIKTRLGFNSVDFTWHEFLLRQRPAMLTVHARTRKEMSKVPAHWEDLAVVREIRDRVSPETIFVGNGDIMNYAQGLELANRYHLDGIMIGRGIFHDPFAFAMDSPWESYTREQRITLFLRQIELFAATWKQGERQIAPLNKFSKIYINGFDGAKELRERLAGAQTIDELRAILS